VTITRHTPINELPEVCRVQEVATVLDCSVGVVYEMIRHGQLAHLKLGRLIRVPRSSVAALVGGHGGER
jgi:excisionase family DNA binding protein